MMDSLRAFIVRWRPWLLGAGVLLIADMYNGKNDTNTANATPVNSEVERTVSAPAEESQDAATPPEALAPLTAGAELPASAAL